MPGCGELVGRPLAGLPRRVPSGTHGQCLPAGAPPYRPHAGLLPSAGQRDAAS